MKKSILYACLVLAMGAHAQEKVYLHLDRYAYSPGETIWFKAYLLAGFDPSTLSRTIYFDWYDVSGRLLKHMAAPVLEASARGQFDIPAGYTGGSIHVRAYTQWMLNFDAALLYNKDIPVAGADHHPQNNAAPAKTELTFFPEGGALITGLPCKVAFKANNQWGVPVIVSGVVQGSDGSFVDSLTVDHDGMGSFFIRPQQGVKYWAVYIDASGRQSRTELPAADAEGVGLQVQPRADRSTVIVRRTAKGATGLKLVVHMNQNVVYAAQLNLAANPEVAIPIPTDSLPTGVLQYTLFSVEGKPLAERVSFVNNHLHSFPVDIKTTTTGLGKRALNAIELDVADSVFTNLSVSVTDADLPAGSDDIVSTLLLSDDIRGAVYHPSYYFSSGGATVSRQLDLVMLTHGWRRFSGQGGLPERRYSQAGLPAPPLPPTNRLPDTTGMQRVQYFEAESADKEKKRQAMMLAAVTVKGHTKRPVEILDEKYTTGPFKREAGYQFDVKDDPLAVHSTDIFYYLRQVVPGLDVKYKDGYPVVTWRQSTPGFFVDEAGMRADLVGDIPITEIAYVKVFYPPFLMGGVINPRAGAIAIYTKKGEDVKPLPTKGLNYTLVEGYAAERQFYSPDYSVDPASQTDFLPDVRPTLYWNPYIITDANIHTAEFKFYNNDVSRRLRVVVEGMNATGRLVHVEKIIE